MNHPTRQHLIAIGRNRSDADGALAGIVKRTSFIDSIEALVENLGPANLVLTAWDSDDNGATDAWGQLTLYKPDEADAVSVTVVPLGRVQFRLPVTTKAFVKFEVTPKLVSFGKITLNYISGILTPYVHESNPPLAASSLSVTAISSVEIDLSWTDNSNDEMEFHVERSPDNITFTEIAVVAAGSTSYKDTGLTEGTRYYYRVRAKGNDVYSAYTSVVNTYTYSASPSGLAAVQVSATQIDLSWVDNSGGETGFKVQRSADGLTSWSTINSPAANSTTYSNTGLTQNTTYYYRVLATNVAGDSVPSNVANATTKLATPTVLAAASTVTGRIDLTWTDNATGETGYSVERSDDGTTGWVEIATPAANAASYQNTGVTVGQTKYYRVRATKTGVNSAYSNVASAVASA